MHFKASFRVMARLVNQQITNEQDALGRNTENYLFRLVTGDIVGRLQIFFRIVYR